MQQDKTLVTLFNFFMAEYQAEQSQCERVRQVKQFYYEMSEETFLILAKTDSQLLENLPVYVMSGSYWYEGEGKKKLGELYWNNYYVPLLQEDSLPKGKAVLRKKLFKVSF